MKYPKWPIYAKSLHKTELSNFTKNEIVLSPMHGAPPTCPNVGGNGDRLRSLTRRWQLHLTQLKYIPATLLVSQEGGASIYFTVLHWYQRSGMALRGF